MAAEVVLTPFAPEIASCSLGRSQSRRKKKSRDIKKCVFDLYKCTRNQGRHAARTPSAIYYQTWWSPPSPPCCRLPVGGCLQADASPSDASYCELRGRCYLMRTLIGFQVVRSNCTWLRCGPRDFHGVSGKDLNYVGSYGH